jgi:membrane protease YdiL (CAAX protease family)
VKSDIKVVPYSAEEIDQREEAASTIRPLPWWQAALFFGIPAILFALNYHLVALPSLDHDSLALIAIALIGPYVLLLAASLVAYRLEGNILSWAALKDRFRFQGVAKNIWFLAAILLVFSLLANWLLIAIRQQIFRSADTSDMGYAVNMVSDNGKWLIFLGMLAQVFFNVIGEEAWWRGYILPRQELTYGKYAWLIHGIMWTLFHIYQWWDLAALLPICLSIAYVSQRGKSIWPALVMHFAFNSIDLGLLILNSF